MKKAPEGAPTQGKDTHIDQFNQTKAAFFSEPKTMMMAAKEINVDRSNICWYIRDLRKINAVWIVKVDKCPITGYPHVGFYSTDPKYAAKQPKQLSLF